jgi:hypothetical protein
MSLKEQLISDEVNDHTEGKRRVKPMIIGIAFRIQLSINQLKLIM